MNNNIKDSLKRLAAIALIVVFFFGFWIGIFLGAYTPHWWGWLLAVGTGVVAWFSISFIICAFLPSCKDLNKARNFLTNNNLFK